MLVAIGPFLGGNVLLVAHGASLETCSRQLCREEVPSQNDFYRILHATPYLANVRLKETDKDDGWYRVGSAVLPLQHSSNSAYNFRVTIASSIDWTHNLIVFSTFPDSPDKRESGIELKIDGRLISCDQMAASI